MTNRLTIDEFFTALKLQNKSPCIDTVESRQAVERKVTSLTKYYPIKDRWPVLDLESAYESYLNNRTDLMRLVNEYGYSGVVNLEGYDERYTIDEWFGDFLIQYKLKDTSDVRTKMIKELSNDEKWNAGDLYQAYQKAVRFSLINLIKDIF